MFEAAKLGRKVSKEVFKEQEPELRTELLEAQRQLRDSNISVVAIVSGVEGAGKVVYLANGHDLRAFECPALRQLWLNAVRWLMA